MSEILFARIDDVDASAAITAKEAAEAAQAAAESAASDASTDADTASQAALDAQNAQIAAEAAQLAAEVAADNFDDVYLGSKAADPTLDNDGNPLVEGQLYWNSSTNSLMVYDGAAWNNYNPTSGLAAVVDDTTPQLGGDLDPNGHAITGYSTTAQANALYQPLDADLTAIAGLTSAANKVPYFTGAGTAAVTDFTAYGRSIVGVADEAAFKALVNLEAGTDVQAYDATLAALAAYNTNGILTQTAADTFAGRTITGTANQITVTNGNGVSGNPTLSLPSDVIIPMIITAPNSGLHILDTNASHDLIITPGSDLTADRVLTITTGDAARTITVSANATISQDYSTTGNPQFATIELGAASDTTISRSAAGQIAVEGVDVITLSNTKTVTNKRITRRLATTNAPGATPTTNTDNVDVMSFTGLNTAITSMTTNLSGTPNEGDLLEFKFLDNGTARGITWGASFASSTVTLPTTTVISTTLHVGFEWSGSVWRCIAVA